MIEVPGINPESDFEMQYSLELLSFLMKSSKELEVQAMVNFQTLVTQPFTMDLIQTVREEPLDLERLNNQPGMIGLTMSPKDSLWNIAKTYHTTREAILKTNHLEDKQVADGTKLLLIKQVSAK